MSKSADRRRPRIFGLRFKFALFVSIAFAASGVVFGYFFSQRFEDSLRTQFEQRGHTLTRGLARNSWVYLHYRDRPQLRALLHGALEEPDVIAAAVYDDTGRLFEEAKSVEGVLPGRVDPSPQSFERRGTTPAGQPVLSFGAPVRRARVVTEEDEEGAPDPFELFPEGSPERGELGTMVIVFSLEEVERRIAEVQRTALQITGLTIGAGVLLVILLSRIFVTPIVRIAATARRIAAGDREGRAQVRSRDEIGELADAFNTMTATLAARELELRDVNVGLEQKVRERTRELQAKQEELLAANVELERANRLKSEFLANMSHELRTPLNAVNGFSELLLEQLHGELTPKQKRYVENILSSGRHLLQLINDILDLSKIEAGRMEVHYEEFSLRQVIENAASVVQPLAEKKGLQVDVSVEEGVDQVVLDAGKIRQILYNLLSNAVKFTDEGKVAVQARKIDERDLEVVVEDTGIGIAEQDQSRIFREFEQVDGSHSRKYEGTGLGLGLSRRLVELQGGTIEVESEIGHGSRFILRLPRDASRRDKTGRAE